MGTDGKQLDRSPQGLSEEEARQRLAKYGYNELAEKRVNPLLKFLAYFWGPIPWLIEAAILLSAILGRWLDLGIIVALLLANAAVGFWEEYQAGNAVAALKATLALLARTKRSGVWRTIQARELVPGDLIRLRLGDIVPADAKLLQGSPVEIDQSTLTGESLPVTRSPGEEVFSGSIVRQGEIDAEVTATGQHTYFGKTTQLVESARTVSHLQQAIIRIADYLIFVAIGLVVLILVVEFLRGASFLTVLQFTLVLIVAAIPVAMPAVLSVTMAVGSRKLAQQKAIVTKLAAIDELAGLDILCVDKTGTLTKNQLTLGEPAVFQATDVEQLLISGALASREEDQDPIDLAVIRGMHDRKKLAEYTVVEYQPFDPVHKRTEATIQGPTGPVFKVSKGAPQVILALAADKARIESAVGLTVERFAARGFRSLGVARTDEHGRWLFLGVLPLYDPPREDSRSTIETARKMGLRIKMLTGDQLAIAKEIARRVGLSTSILDASVFAKQGDRPDSEMATVVEKADGFAQVFPEHKYRIVSLLQEQGHIVGMTGDGVNDAPPLKKADAGIAVSGATDAARAAADIVLLSPGLSVIIDAIKQSRMAFRRMNSYAIYRIAETIRVLLFLSLSILIFSFYPVTPIMIVLLAVLNDGAILSIAYDHTRYSNQPERWKLAHVLPVATALGLTGLVASFTLLYLATIVFHLPLELIPSLIYLKLSVAGHLTIFIARTRYEFWSIPPAPILVIAVFGTQLLATLITVYGIIIPPIGWNLALLVWGYAIIFFLITDRVKLGVYRLLEWREHRSITF